MSVDTGLTELLWGELDSLRVVSLVERAGDGEASGGTGLADEAQDGWVIDQRPSGPAFADLGKEPVLNGIPFGGAGGIMIGQIEIFAAGSDIPKLIHRLLRW